MPAPLPISACLICKNAEKLITLALDSVAWCDEIVVVVDTASTDRTAELAQAHPSGKVRVLYHDWLGFNGQRKYSVEQCKHDWVLMLDADEECSEELRKELQALTAQQLEKVGLCEMPRKNHLAKRHVRCWGPDYQTRFGHKDRIAWDPAPIPEHREPKRGYKQKRLRAPLLHNRLTPLQLVDLCDGRRMQEYGLSLGETMHRKGKRAGWINLWFRPPFTFVKYYLFKRGFMDGRFGLIIAYKTVIIVMLKYSVLYGKEIAEPTQAESSRERDGAP